VSLDGGGTALAVEAATGAVMLTLFPWEVALEPKDAPSVGSAQNRLPVRVSSVTRLGNRMRVGLRGPQPLVAELTAASAERLDLRRGVEVVATWKATATRLVPLG
jgi:molybdopterin-binding protein